MGCCNSKTKGPKKAAKQPTPRQNSAAPVRAPSTPLEDRRRAAAAAARAKAAQELEENRNKRVRAIAALRDRPTKYHNAEAEDGELKPCFGEGLAYRIVKGDTWFFYNDTLDQELHVDYRLGPSSAVQPGERTTLTTTEDGWQQAHMVVYPLETVPYLSGTINGYKSSVSLKALSEAYLAAQAAQADETVQRELCAVEDLVGDETDEEAILRRCVETNTPYVDIHFVPDQIQLSRPGVDARPMPTAAMMRPTQYLPEDQRDGVDAIRGPVVPESIERGKLGDCWLMCSAAVLAESRTAVPNVFSQAKPEEKAVGAYRVVLNKNGWWRTTVVDSYLPTVGRHPLFACSSDDPRELWVALYQKAYAKMHGSYASITGGDALQAIQDFTGAPTFRFDKEWAIAANSSTIAEDMVRKLKARLAAGHVVVLSTPSPTSTTYLSQLREADPDMFKTIFAKAGLELGYSYVVESIDGDSISDAYFKLRNPWRGKSELLAGTFGSTTQKGEEEAFEHTAEKGCVWMPWKDLVNYFDGGGFVYPRVPSTHYRVKGVFSDVQPTTVLQIRVTEPVTVQLVLSQTDKRGLPIKSPDARYAPLMLSVSKPEEAGGVKHRVHQNTAGDITQPSATEYNFSVARDVAMEYTFLPNEGPYLIIPRIHRKGVQNAYDRPYVVGIIADGPLDGKMSVQLKQVERESRVFKNILTFPADNLETVEAEWQVYTPGALPHSETSTAVLTLPDDAQREATPREPTPKSPTPSHHSSGAPSDHAEEHSQDEQPVAAVSDDDDVVVQSRAVPAAAQVAEAVPQVPTPIADDMAPSAPVPDSDNDSDKELSTPKHKTPTPKAKSPISSEELSTPKPKTPTPKSPTPKAKTPTPKSPTPKPKTPTPKSPTPKAKTPSPKSPVEKPKQAAPSAEGPSVSSANRFAALRVSDSVSDSEL